MNYIVSDQSNSNLNKISLPNSTAVLVLGIVSIALCCMYGIVGLSCGIIALVLARKGKQIYTESPELYTQTSLSNLNAGRTCAIIGTCLSSLVVIFFIAYLVMIGTYLSLLFAFLGAGLENM